MNLTRIAVIILLLFSLNSCAFFRGIFGGSSSKENPQSPEEKTETEVIYDTPEEIPTYDEMLRKGKSDYLTAQAYEDEYYTSSKRQDAITAIKYFESYYSSLPNGIYAAIALLKKIELLVKIGELTKAKSELNRLLRRSDLIKSYREEIDYIQRLLR